MQVRNTATVCIVRGYRVEYVDADTTCPVYVVLMRCVIKRCMHAWIKMCTGIVLNVSTCKASSIHV